MSKISPPMSSARRSAEAPLNQSMTREASFKWEQEREYEAMVSIDGAFTRASLD
jgi:hypothetical protein